MYKLVFDTEASGIPNWKIPSDDPSQPHIVALAAVLFDTDTGRIINTLDTIIRPDGWKIIETDPDGDGGNEAFKVHGISHEHAMDVGIPESAAAGMIHVMARGRTRIAYNTTFDNRIVRIALKRHFGNDLADEWKAGDYECAMMAAKKVMKVKSVKLVDAYKHFTGRELTEAHNAMADTLAAKDIYMAIQDAQACVVDPGKPEDFEPTPKPIPVINIGDGADVTRQEEVVTPSKYEF